METIKTTRVLLLLPLAMLALLVDSTHSQCSLPSETEINSELEQILITELGEGADVKATLLNYHFTCLAVRARDLYRSLSVAVNYTTSTSGSDNFLAQIQMTCGSLNSFERQSPTPFDQATPASVFFNVTRRDCRSCSADSNIPNSDTDANCLFCSSTCQAVGQGACSTVAGTTCCPFFTTDGSCTTSCPSNFAASASTNYTCACNLTCKNGGTPDQSNCTLCSCMPDFTGKNCEAKIDDCASSPCVNGTCIDGVNSYSCQCQAGFTGINCETDINECASSPCVTGTCIDGINSYSCQCQAGFTGINCETDIDDCASSPCVTGTCIDGVNSYSCQCQAGFTGINCETDIDECASSPCVTGTCIDGINSYSCQCQAGFTGINCETDIDDCASSPCVTGTCIDGVNSYSCQCQAGFTGINCETDIDECASSPCVNGTCINGVNSFTCQCQAGFTGTNCNIDIDDCDPNPCVNNGTCIDGVNSFSCQCQAGFTGTNCNIDIDDCDPNPCMNGGNCTSQPNGFVCTCADRFAGTTCSNCEAGFVLQPGRCVEDCNTTCSGKAAFDRDICHYACLVRIWRQQSEDCNVSLPELTTNIDTSLPVEEQWNMAVRWWTELHDAWASEASRRGINVDSTPELASGQTDIYQWTSILEQWSTDQQTWQQSATQLRPDFPVQDLSTLNFNFPADISRAQLSSSHAEVVNFWTTASSNYRRDLADQCPA